MEIKVEQKVANRPSFPDKRFDTNNAYKEMKTIIDRKLDKKTYETEEAAKMCKELADEIRNKMRVNIAPRYKIFVIVSIFSQKGQGVRHCSRCYYDPETDYEITYVYQNQDLIGIATVYAIYYY